MGGSLGGWIGSILAGVDHRIKAAVLTVPATEFAREQTPAGRIINSSNFFPRISPVRLLMVIAKRDSPVRNDRARALFKLVTGQKKVLEYDEGHFLPPQKYNKEILQWLDQNL